MSEIRSVQVSTNTGQYHLTSSEESWCLELRVFFEDGSLLALSETFDVDDHPDFSWGDDPADVLDALDERLESYWINTGRDKARERSARLRELMPAIRRKWITDKIERLEKELDDCRNVLAEITAHTGQPEPVYEGQKSD